MKKFLLSILCFAGLVAANAETATFNFNDPTTLTPSVTPQENASNSYDGTQGVVISGQVFTNNGVSFVITKGSTDAKIWTNTNLSCELRAYKTATITITAPENKVLTNITIDGSPVTLTASTGNYTSGIWSGSDKEVVFSVADDAKTQKYNTFTVTYDVEGSTGGDITLPKFGYVTKVNTGKKYLIVTDSKTMDAQSTEYYLPASDVIIEDSYITAKENMAFTIEAVDGGYTLKNSLGKYLYLKDSYKSFNQSATRMDDNSDVWTIESQGDGTVAIKNVLKGKTIQLDSNYGTYGAYDDVTFALPMLYEEGATAEVVETVESPVFSPDGGVFADQPTLTLTCATEDAEIWYTKNGELTFKEDGTGDGNEGTFRYSSPIFVPSTCTIQAVAVKNGKKSPVVKKRFVISYLNSYTSVSEVADKKSYILVANNVALSPVDINLTNEYPSGVEVKINDAGIINTLAYYALTLSAVEGGYTLRDGEGRYLYMTTDESYTKINASTELPEEGGVWTITIDNEGKAKVLNVLSNKYIQYSAQHSSYGCYPDERGELPSIYGVYDYKPELILTGGNNCIIVTCEDGIILGDEEIVNHSYNSVSDEYDEVYFSITPVVLSETQIQLNLSPAITVAGEYYLNVKKGYFILNPGVTDTPMWETGISTYLSVNLEVSGIDDVLEDNPEVYTVYNLQGIKLMETKDATQVEQLPAGIYIVNGQKVALGK